MSSSNLSPVTGPSAWRGPDLVDDPSWVRAFTAAELDELDAATRAIRQRGLGPFDFGNDAFPLPTLGPVLSGLLESLEGGRGFVLLRGIPVERYDEVELDILYAGLCTYFGHVITQNSKGDRIGRVTDHGTDYTTKNVRGHTSNDAIAPHCDSSDIVGLLCVQTAGRGGESKVASSHSVFNAILSERPELIEPLRQGFSINLAGTGPTGRLEECSANVIPVFSHYQGFLSCRFNEKQILDGARIQGHELTALQKRAITAVAQTAMRDDIRLDMDFRPGDIQLLNNHTVLHARGAYEDDSDNGRRRRLLRIWINMAQGRPLAPEFADRLNSGPRGEVTVLG